MASKHTRIPPARRVRRSFRDQLWAVWIGPELERARLERSRQLHPSQSSNKDGRR